jgi:endoglucanase
MYAILNTHHDDWVSLMPAADQTAVANQLAKLWTQIAVRFKNYGDHLIFETLNEPRTKDNTEWTGGTADARKRLNAYNVAAVNAIRASGGNNAKRYIMIPTHGANSSTTCINDLVIPDNDARIIVSIHTYWPYNFSAGDGVSTWGSSADLSAMNTELDRIASLLPKKGRAAVVGEWGSINQNNTASRVAHAKAYSEAVIKRGMAAIWWDNGGLKTGKDNYGLLNRSVTPPSWSFPEIVQALSAGATTGAESAP